jgi:hypothetical protein
MIRPPAATAGASAGVLPVMTTGRTGGTRTGGRRHV